MAKIKYDVRGVDPGGDRVLPSAGLHPLKITSLVDGHPAGKDRRLEVQAQVTDDNPKGSKGYVVYDYILLEREDLEWKLAQFVKAMGLPPNGSFDADEIVGTGCSGRLKIRPETEEYSAKAVVGTWLPLDGDAAEEDLEEEDDATDDESDDGDDDELWTEKELEALSNDELKEVATEMEIEVPSRLTAKSKPKLIAAILEAQEEGEDEEEEYSEEDFEEMTDDDVKEVLEEFELDADDYVTSKKKGKKTVKTFDKAAAVAAILEAQEEGEDEDGDEEEEEEEDETPDYESMELSELKALAKERKLDQKGSKKVLIARLTKDDEPF